MLDVGTASTTSASTRLDIAADMADGAMASTGADTDLALMGPGFFAVASDNGLLFTRQGQFLRDPDGRLVTTQGLAVQTDGGRDLALDAGAFEVTSTGVVLQGGLPVARLAVVAATDPRSVSMTDDGLFVIAENDRVPVDDPIVQQGMLEASNVSAGREMTAMMQALRQAETAQRLVNVYDDLMGRAITTFGQH